MSIRIFLAIALLAGSVIAYQINLVQIFSYIQWYHFAYMAISIALLGFGFAGSLLSVYEAYFSKHFQLAFSIICFLAGIWMSLVMLLINSPILQVELFHIQLSWLSLVKLMGFYLILCLPFFFAALAIGMSFTKYSSDIGRLYFYDLLGSGIGALAIVFLSWRIFPHDLGVWLAFIPWLAGMITLTRPTYRKGGIGSMVCLITILYSGWQAELPSTSEYKPLSKARLLPEAQKIYEGSSPRGVIEMVNSPVLRYAPGLSYNYTGEVPPVNGIFLNGEWLGAIPSSTDSFSMAFMDYTSQALGLQLAGRGPILVLGDPTLFLTRYIAGKQNNQIHTLLESNDLKEILEENYSKEGMISGVHEAMNVHVSFLKSYLLNDDTSYDLVLLPTLGQLGSSGMNAIREEYNLTLENLSLIWNHLSDTGVIAIHCWLDSPVKAPLRVFKMICEVLSEEGADRPLDHMISIKNWSLISFYIRKTAWDQNAFEKAETFAEKMQFDLFVDQGKLNLESNWQHDIGDTNFMRMMDCIVDGDETCINQYDFDIRSTTDQRPYFYKFIRSSRVFSLMKQYGNQLFYLEIGYFFMFITFGLLTILAFIFIVLPLLKLNLITSQIPFTFFYFMAIGIGYMFIEISFIHGIIPYLGSPLYAFSLTLAALLISSGLGSYFSHKVVNTLSAIQRMAITLILILLIYYAISDDVWNAITTWSWLRLPAAFIVVAIPGFFMGWFFPLGIKYLHQKRTMGMIPWAWGVNGFFSVLAAALAIILATELGFKSLEIIAIITYSIPLIIASANKRFS